MTENQTALRRTVLACLLLAAATLAAYWQVLGHDFVNYDDNLYVTDNAQVQTGLTPRGLLWAFTTTDAANWHPMTWLSHMTDCAIFGLDPSGHHLTNLLFHIANSLLLFWFLKQTTHALGRSLIVAALFALHPLHVESVAWISERKDVLSGFFWLLATLAYIGYAERPNARRYALVLLLFVCGLLAKPMVVTLPLVLILMDYWPLGRVGPALSNAGSVRASWRRCVVEKLPLAAISALFAAVTLFAQQSGGSMRSFERFPLGERCANALLSYVIYIAKMLWPVRLAVYYPHPGAGLPQWAILGAAAFLVGMTLVSLLLAKRCPYLMVGWLLYAVTLLPVAGFVQVGAQAYADRYTYLPLIGLFIIAAWGIPDLAKRLRIPGKALSVPAAALLVALTAVTCFQVRHWRTSTDLWTHAIEVTSDNGTAHYNLGNVLFRSGKFDEAAGHYAKAAAVSPYDFDARTNLGMIRMLEGKTEQAIGLFRQAIQIEPSDHRAYYHLGRALLKTGDTERAVANLSKSLELKPDLRDAHERLANVLLEQGRTQEALPHFEEALRLEPEDARAHINMGIALALLNRFDDAAGRFQNALRIEPYSVEARFNLANTLLRQNKFEEAAEEFSNVLQTKPDDPDAHYGLGCSLAQLGRYDDAERHFLETLRVNPGHAAAREQLQQLKRTKEK